ncbi:hypothetical protein L208DRAFT_1521085 [Tricholoma matsutake]|nr:hypothetical protein L208DRAFT_1521085 [Tricholoma matsutake 945]
MNRGSYACMFLFTFKNNFQVVGCVVLPGHEIVKTEAEVVAWKWSNVSIHFTCTDIPVAQVYIYCSSANNPVRAEWILMEYLWGQLLGDCFRRPMNQQKLHTSVDLAMVMSSLFIIIASYIGSLLPELCKDDSNGGHYALQPMNDITLLDYPNQRPNNKLDCWAFNKVFKVYCTIQCLYRGFMGSSSDQPDKTFHFSHGDLSSWNILVDPQSSMITSVIDWEMASFCPTWLTAIAGGWFNDDQDQFLMTDDQSHHLKYGDDNLGDAELHSHFCLQLVGQNMELFCHYWLSPEVRAIFYACCHADLENADIWLVRYEKHEWDLRLH